MNCSKQDIAGKNSVALYKAPLYKVSGLCMLYVLPGVRTAKILIATQGFS